MNKDISSALNESDPFDAIWAFENCFDCDRENLEKEPNVAHRVLVTASMFANVFGASGYAGVVYELHGKLGLILEALEMLQLTGLAQEMRRVISLAEEKALNAQSDEDDWSVFVSENGDFRGATQRDVPGAAALIAAGMKNFVTSNPQMFDD